MKHSLTNDPDANPEWPKITHNEYLLWESKLKNIPAPVDLCLLVNTRCVRCNERLPRVLARHDIFLDFKWLLENNHVNINRHTLKQYFPKISSGQKMILLTGICYTCRYYKKGIFGLSPKQQKIFENKQKRLEHVRRLNEDPNYNPVIVLSKTRDYSRESRKRQETLRAKKQQQQQQTNL